MSITSYDAQQRKGVSTEGIYDCLPGVLRFRSSYMEGLIIWEPLCLPIMSHTEALCRDNFIPFVVDEGAADPRQYWDLACLSIMGE